MRALCLFAYVVASASGLALGCGGHDSPAPLARAAAPIVNGVLDDGTNDDVVLLEADLGGGMAAACTGTLVAHKVVVTARHCVSQVKPGGYDLGADYAPASIDVWLGARPRGAPDALGAKILHDDASNLVNHDLAVLVLDRRIGTQLSPMRLTSPAAVGETVKVVGYGLTETDTAPLTQLHARYMRPDLKVLQLGPGTYFTPMTYDLASSELSLGESICEGDSGGPVKDQASDALLAVTSRGGNGTGSTSYPFSACLGSRAVNAFTRLDPFAKLITDAIASVGEQPWLEGAPQPAPPAGAPLGGTCVGAGDCEAGAFCAPRAGVRYCATSCSAAACPAGFLCDGKFCFSESPPPADDAGATSTPAAASSKGCSLSSTAHDTTRAPRSSAGALLGLALLGLVRHGRRRSRAALLA